ncbi:MAG TPA: hypothetical protein VJG90_02975 [Candidatus Nanoarchaeia archaeon]|nr:hypothetical protein [Candidatus Nanoarchaeia archaeon]
MVELLSAFQGDGPIAGLLPAQLKLFLWGLLALVCLAAYFRIRRIEENFKEVVGFYALAAGLAFLLTGNVLTVFVIAGVMTLSVAAARMHARHQEYGSSAEKGLEDIGAGGSGLRQRLEGATRVNEELTRDKNPGVRGLALAEARDVEASGAELAIEGGASVLPEAELNLLNTSLTNEQRAKAHEARLSDIAYQIANLKELPETAQASMDLMLDFLHELVLESEQVIESEQGADKDRLKVIAKMKKVLTAMKLADKRAEKFRKEEQKIRKSLSSLESKRVKQVRAKILRHEKRLQQLEASRSYASSAMRSQVDSVTDAKATLEGEVQTLKQGLASLQQAEQILNGLMTQLGEYVMQMSSQLSKIDSTVNKMASVEGTMEGFESREQQLKANLTKAQGKFASTVVDLGHDKIEGHLEQVDDLVVKSQGGLTGFFEALSQSKQALLDFRQELSTFLGEVSDLAAETHGLESLSAASQKLQDQVVGGFAQLDGLAEKLLGDNPMVELELDQITRLSKQTEAELLQGVAVENKMFDRTMTEVSAANSQLNAFGKVVVDELNSIKQTRDLTFSSLTRILKLVAAKTAELSAEVTQRAGKLSRDMASTAEEVGKAA